MVEKKRQKYKIAFLACLWLGFLVSEPILAQNSPETILLIGQKKPTAFWSDLLRGARDAANVLQIKLKIIQPPSTPRRISSVLDVSVDAKPSAILLPLVAPEQQAASIKRGLRKKIPLASIGDYARESNELGMVFHVGRSQLLEGQIIGANFSEYGVKKILCLANKVPEDAYCVGSATYFDTKTIFLEKQPEFAVEKLRRAMAEEDFDGVLIASPELWPLLRHVLIEKNPRPLIATTALNQQISRAMDAGEIAFVSVDQPYLQGYLAVSQIVFYKRFGLKPDKMTATGGILKTSKKWTKPR